MRLLCSQFFEYNKKYRPAAAVTNPKWILSLKLDPALTLKEPMVSTHNSIKNLLSTRVLNLENKNKIATKQ